MTAQLALTMQQEADRLGLLSPRAKRVGRGDSCAAYAPLPKIESCCAMQCGPYTLIYSVCECDDIITKIVLI